VISRVPSVYLQNALVDNGVSLVTSGGQGRLNAMTVSFFAESSHVPVLVRIAVAPTCLTHRLISASGWFGLSVLARGQEKLAIGCGTVSGYDVPKFERLRLSYRITESGTPLLPGCLTTSECRVVQQSELAGHTLFIGEVTRSYRQTALSDREILLVSDLSDYLE